MLNIKEKVVNSERHTYVMGLVGAMRGQGWLWTEEFIWHKKNCFPGKWPNRFRDSFERLFQFNKQKAFNMYQDEVRVPVSAATKVRLRYLRESDRRQESSDTGSGFARRMASCVTRDLAYPTNVLLMATETANKNHSAVFPKELPSWFIKLFTKPGDVVLDPFVGSGTTAAAAKSLGRNFIGIEIREDYCAIARKRVQAEGTPLSLAV